MCRNSLLRQYETFIAVQLFVHRQTQSSGVFFCFVSGESATSAALSWRRRTSGAKTQFLSQQLMIRVDVSVTRFSIAVNVNLQKTTSLHY